MKCCGVHEPSEWNRVLGHLHPACCGKDIKDNTCTLSSSLYQKGCKDAFREFVDSHLFQVIGVAIGVGVFQVSVKMAIGKLLQFDFR